MANLLNLKFKIITDRKVPFWWRIAYLIPDVLHDKLLDIRQFETVISGKDTKFGQFIQKHLSAYIDKGTMPPEAIVGPILNIAEDIQAGREPTLRSGDYIAIQNELRR